MSKDELIWTIKLRYDDDSFNLGEQKFRDLEKLSKKSFSPETTEGAQEFKEALKELDMETATHIDRLIELQKNIDAYSETLKNLRKIKRDNVEINEQMEATEVSTRAALKDTRAEYRDVQKSMIAATNAGEGQVATYNELSARNRELKAAMGDIPWDDTTGKLDELKKEWAENNQKLKEFDAELGDHRRNVGNYSEAMTTAASAMATFQGPLGPIAGRINSLNTTIRRAGPLLRGKATGWALVGRAMLATGIGAIVVALGTLIAALRTLQPVIDSVAKRMDQLAAVWGFVRTAIGAFLGLNEKNNRSLNETISLAGRLREAQIALEEQQIKNITATAELEAQIAELRQAAEDENLATETRLELMEEARKELIELMTIKHKELEQELWIARQRLSLSESGREEREKVAELEARLIGIRQQAATQDRQLLRRQQTLNRQLQVEEERRRRNIQAIQDEVKALRDASTERQRTLQEDMSLELQRANRMIELERRVQGDIVGIRLQRNLDTLLLNTKEEEAFNELEEKKAEFVEARTKEILKTEEGVVSEQEALRRARVDAHMQFVSEEEAIEQHFADQRVLIYRDAEHRISDIKREEEKVRDNIREQVQALRAEQIMRQEALEEALITGRNAKIIQLELEREARMNELRDEFRDKGFDDEEARQLAHDQAMLEFEQQFQDTKTAIQQQAMQDRLDMMESTADLAFGIMNTAFGDTKEVRVAQAIIDTYTAANRALASADWPLSAVRAAAAIAMGMANVRQILSTNVGDRPSGTSASEAALSSVRGFEVTGDDQDEGAVARQVADSASENQGQEMNPTFVFEGDLNKEVMAIKVRQGNRMINSRTVTTQSKGQ